MFKDKENRRWFGSIVVMMWCFAIVGTALAHWPEQDKLLATDGAASDHFGSPASTDGNYAIVGAHAKGGNTGAAYIFAPNEIDPNYWDQQDYWDQQAKLTASDGAAGDHFAFSVSISGDYVIVGADRNNGNGLADSGSAYIFERSDNPSDPNWYEQCKLTASDGQAGDNFGYCVSIEGDYALVGAYLEDVDGLEDSGSAYIFKRSDVPDDPNWYEQCKLTASDGEAGDTFGNSVSISSGYVIVAACKDDDNGTNSGSAYIFQHDGENWVQRKKLIPSDGEPGEYFGAWVSIGADYAVIGAHWDDDNGSGSGSAYIFKELCPIGDLLTFV